MNFRQLHNQSLSVLHVSAGKEKSDWLASLNNLISPLIVSTTNIVLSHQKKMSSRQDRDALYRQWLRTTSMPFLKAERAHPSF